MPDIADKKGEEAVAHGGPWSVGKDKNYLTGS